MGSATDLLVVMVRNPVPGKVKTRLAEDIGDELACSIYMKLLERTRSILKGLDMNIRISFDGSFEEDRIWNESAYQRMSQCSGDLGERMKGEFIRAFEEGYECVCLLGSDILDLEIDDIVKAFERLGPGSVVLGPAHDGGYYMVGIDSTGKEILDAIFSDIPWGTDEVLNRTREALDSHEILTELITLRSDVDTADDLPSEWRPG